jgi:hypothetical protein
LLHSPEWAAAYLDGMPDKDWAFRRACATNKLCFFLQRRAVFDFCWPSPDKYAMYRESDRSDEVGRGFVKPDLSRMYQRESLGAGSALVGAVQVLFARSRGRPPAGCSLPTP